MGKLTTHILDTASGRPGADISIELFYLNSARQSAKKVRSNADGRTEHPLLEGDEFKTGVWELVFSVGDYYRQNKRLNPESAFLEDVVIRFSITADEHFHVPLLVSPFGYSTYRGS
ncbi:MAG: hydroxyisourate hydrolase [Pseudomonadales bacterium]|nr:hydroxyisourate hydrolase [Pseudomonadales bacterium]